MKQKGAILYKNIHFIKCETGKYLQMLEQNYKYCGEWQKYIKQKENQ